MYVYVCMYVYIYIYIINMLYTYMLILVLQHKHLSRRAPAWFGGGVSRCILYLYVRSGSGL